MTGKSKTKIKRLWAEVQKKQKQIQKIVSQAWIKINQEWWEEISQLDAKSDPSEFYKLCRKFKCKQDSSFPTALQDDEGKMYRTKDDIKKHTIDYYTENSNNKDTPATDFYASLGLDAEGIKEFNSKANSRFRGISMYRENEERISDEGPCDDGITIKALENWVILESNLLPPTAVPSGANG